jgi:hydroxyacylglutathione hydrolase
MWWLVRAALRYGALAGGTFLGVCYFISTLARAGVDDPCPAFPLILRVMYGLFGTRITHLVLGHIAHTKPGQQQPAQTGGTLPRLAGAAETGSSLRVAILPVLGEIFGGNYAYVIYDEDDTERRAVVVDGADPEVVLRYVADAGLKLTYVLTTHWHWDHSGGNRKLHAAWPNAMVVGGREEGWRVPCASTLVEHGDALNCGPLFIKCHGLRGHTRGSICYEINVGGAKAPPALFTGDGLFVGGCGALFEGSAAILFSQLGRLFSALPPDTLLFAGHEYSVMLLTQAVMREPANEAARRKLSWARTQRASRKPTVPSRLGDELSYNGWAREASIKGDFGLFCRLCGVDDASAPAADGARKAKDQ